MTTAPRCPGHNRRATTAAATNALSGYRDRYTDTKRYYAKFDWNVTDNLLLSIGGPEAQARFTADWGPRLALPSFLLGQGPSGPEDWLAGLRLTRHFLERDAFGLQHRGLPAVRTAFEDRVAALLPAPAGPVAPDAPPR